MEVIQHSFTLYRKALVNCLPLSFLIAVGINAPFLFFEYKEPLDFLNQLFSWHDYKTGLMLVIWVLSLIGLVTHIIRLNAIKYNTETNVSDQLARAVSNFFPLLLVALLYSIMVVCGIAFLIIPGLILAVSLMFSFIIRIFENKTVFDCLVASHKLVWGHWWYSVLILSVPVLLNLVVFLTIYISTVGILTNFSQMWEHAHFFAILLNTILQIFFIPFILATILTLYYDLKAKQ